MKLGFIKVLPDLLTQVEAVFEPPRGVVQTTERGIDFSRQGAVERQSQLAPEGIEEPDAIAAVPVVSPVAHAWNSDA